MTTGKWNPQYIAMCVWGGGGVAYIFMLWFISDYLGVENTAGVFEI